MPSLHYFPQDLNEATGEYVDRLDAFLQSLGPAGLQDAVLTKRLDLNTIRFELTLTLQRPGPLTLRAEYFSSIGGSPPDTQLAAFFAARPNGRVVAIRDVSQERRRKLDQNAILVIWANSLLPNCGWDVSRPVIVEATALIGVGASGPARLVTTAGLAGNAITVLNRSGAAWANGKRGYAALRPGTCLWDGYPTCC